MSRPFADYLADSLDRIAHDAPRLHALVARTIEGRSLGLVVSGEVVGIRAEGDRVVLAAPREPVDVEASTSRRTIVALADGEDDLESAVVGERISLRGTVEDLGACFEALAAYLNGAARSPELGRLMEEFREEVADGA
jgi:hypothetical protein